MGGEGRPKLQALWPPRVKAVLNLHLRNSCLLLRDDLDKASMCRELIQTTNLSNRGKRAT